MEEKRWDVAERAFLQSLRIEPNSAKTYYLIARARRELANREGALAAIEQAIRLAPKQPEFQDLREQILALPK